MTNEEIRWIVYEWRASKGNTPNYEQIPQEERDRFRQSLPLELWNQIALQGDDIVAERTCDWLYRGYSLQETQRLGYPIIGVAVHDPYMFIDEGKGLEQARELIRKYGLLEPKDLAYEPYSFWQLITYRQNGDAVIGLFGDDRGSMGDPNPYTFSVVVSWNPIAFQERSEFPWKILP